MSEGYSYLLPGGLLAQGSVPPPRVRLPFDVVVLSAVEHQDVDLPGYDVVRVPLDDSGPPPSPADRALIRATAKQIAAHVRAGRRVLVTCHQGRNRSGVLAGLALVELGLPRDRAVGRIRRYRNGLTNPYFRAMVDGRL
jgi:protein-tyrosine phosphatase